MIRALLVDDEFSTLYTIKKLVNFEKYGVELIGEAENGEEAMKYLNASNPPEIVITDMNMPVMDGTSLMRFIQEQRREVQLIVVSGYVNYQYTHAAIRANVIDYLMKPIDPKLLEKALEEAVRKVEERQQLIIYDSDEKMHLAEEIYQLLLKQARELERLIEYRNHRECDRILEKNLKVLEQLCLGKEDAKAVARVLSSSIQRFLAENGEIMSGEELKIATVENCREAIEQIRHIAHRAINILEENRNKNGKYSLEKVLNYIESHYAENIRLEDIAEMFYYNKEYLTTIFKKKYGLNVGEYVIRLRMEEAKRQLRYTTKSMDEIMLSLGYSDVSYFYRQFKKAEGISPGQYRKQMQKKVRD